MNNNYIQSTAFEMIDTFREWCLSYDLDTGFSGKAMGPGYNGGIPVWYDRDRGEILVDNSDQHAILFGSSGSKKTRDVIMPFVQINAEADESMIIHDPKGELFQRLGNRLQENGFHVVVLDFRNCDADCWNPLSFPMECFLNGDEDTAYQLAHDIASCICEDYLSEKDPFWDYSAADVLFGLISSLMVYIKEHQHDAADAEFTNLFSLRYLFFDKSNNAKLFQNWITKHPMLRNALNGTLQAAEDTKRSTLAVLDSKVSLFRIRPNLVRMLSHNSFSMKDLVDKKTAIFLITPDERVNYNTLISLFVTQSYQYLITSAISHGGTLPRRVNFVLDEFSSLPSIGENGSFSAMIAAGRSRGIRFILAVQSYAQLQARYDKEAATIMGNCPILFYLFSRETELLQKLSELCGKDDSNHPNLSVYDLQQLDMDTALLLYPRLRPCICDLIDIDQFHEMSYFIPDKHVSDVPERALLDFHDLLDQEKKLMDEKRKAEEEEKKKHIMSQMPFGLNDDDDDFDSIFNPSIRANSKVVRNDEDAEQRKTNLDDLIRKIDKRIAELELEEKMKDEKHKNSTTDHTPSADAAEGSEGKE